MPNAPAYSSTNRPARAWTGTIGPNDLLVAGLRGEEALSTPFAFTVDLLSNLESIKAADVLHKPMTVALRLTDGPRGAERERFINGVVRSFTTLDRGNDKLTRYRAELVPELWFLSLASDNRTFEHTTALDIVEQLCKDAGITAVRRNTIGATKARPYCVQYGETNLQFVSRLLEEEGVFYFFEHTATAHSLVLADSRSAIKPTPIIDQLDVAAPSGTRQADTIAALEREFAVHSAAVALRAHDSTQVKRGAIKDARASSVHAGAVGERFAYPGELHKVGLDGQARQLVEAAEAGYVVTRASSNCAAVASGYTMRIPGAGRARDPETLQVVRVSHDMRGADVRANGGAAFAYENRFVAIPDGTTYRPPRTIARPTVQGSQTAKVVGSGEIDVDADARVLLQFPWDRGDGKDGRSAHRVRVASAWAGAQWGFVQIPRIGHEVIVEFLEGDPDRPIVTGRVYNADNKPPYALKEHATQSGWKSRSVGSGSGAENFNELRFEDKKDGEELHIQAERDLTVLVKHDETRDVQHDRTTTIKNDDRRTVTEGDDTAVVQKGNQSTTVSRGNITIKASAGKYTLEAMQSIELKVGENSIKISPQGVTIKALTVKIEGDVSAELKSVMTKVQASGIVTVQGSLVQIN